MDRTCGCFARAEPVDEGHGAVAGGAARVSHRGFCSAGVSGGGGGSGGCQERIERPASLVDLMVDWAAGVA